VYMYMHMFLDYFLPANTALPLHETEDS